ncbi:MAG: TPM domain-containing protein [Archangium sp.]|nr:TPM domain-containing protein [Archangium sp.]
MLSLLLTALLAAAPLPPSPSRWLTDEAQVLSPQVRPSLERRLQNHEHATGTEVLVWIGKTTGGEPLESFTQRTVQLWKPGRPRLDNGVVLFVFTEDRRVRMEVGSSLQHVLTPEVRQRLIDERIAPLLKAGEPNVAISSGIDALFTKLTAAPLEAPPHVDELSRTQWITLVVMVLGFAAVLLIARPELPRSLLRFLRRRGRVEGDGFSGGTPLGRH